MSRPVIFLSYSHHDNYEMEKVKKQLKVALSPLGFECWSAPVIQAGDKWKEKIVDAIDRAKIAVLLVSDNFLTSEFINNEEVPMLRKRREEAGLKLVPLIIKDCAWQEVEWLKELEVRPRDENPVWGSDPFVDTVLAYFAREMASIIRGPVPALMPVSARAKTSPRSRKPVFYLLTMFVLSFVPLFYLLTLSRVPYFGNWQIGPVNVLLSSRKYISPNEEREFLLDGTNVTNKNVQVAFQMVNQGPFKCYIGQGNTYFINEAVQKNATFNNRLTASYPWELNDGWSMFNTPAQLSLVGQAGGTTTNQPLDIIIAPVPYIRWVIFGLLIGWLIIGLALGCVLLWSRRARRE
ncbi:MAG TPA: toll/interleukin-1 receptor domain-containing protein [Blastocatellia bacterium]|nr:toll/interleukin-1 receptor domain-containing protein [Blastocatellia bacterium]